MILDREEDREILLYLVNEAVVPVKHADDFLRLRNRITNAEVQEVEPEVGLQVVAHNLDPEEKEKQH